MQDSVWQYYSRYRTLFHEGYHQQSSNQLHDLKTSFHLESTMHEDENPFRNCGRYEDPLSQHHTDSVAYLFHGKFQIQDQFHQGPPWIQVYLKCGTQLNLIESQSNRTTTLVMIRSFFVVKELKELLKDKEMPTLFVNATLESAIRLKRLNVGMVNPIPTDKI